MIVLRFIGLTFLFAVIGALAVLLNWLFVFSLIALGVHDSFVQLLLFLIAGIFGPCWAAFVTYAFLKGKPQNIRKRVTAPAVLGYGLIILAIVAIYGPMTLFGFYYRGVKM